MKGELSPVARRYMPRRDVKFILSAVRTHSRADSPRRRDYLGAIISEKPDGVAGRYLARALGARMSRPL